MGTSVHEQFRRVFNGQTNFMTPDIVYCRVVGNFGVELSKGRGLEAGSTIYGVTVLSDIHSDTPKRESGLSECFPTRALAERYIGKIADNP